MQIYNVPFNFRHEEKIFGGYVSLRQAIYLILGASTLSIFLVPNLNTFVKLVFFLIVATIFSLFAFLKIDGTNADKYFIYILRFIFKKKKYILEKGKWKW